MGIQPIANRELAFRCHSNTRTRCFCSLTPLARNLITSRRHSKYKEWTTSLCGPPSSRKHYIVTCLLLLLLLLLVVVVVGVEVVVVFLLFFLLLCLATECKQLYKPTDQSGNIEARCRRGDTGFLGDRQSVTVDGRRVWRSRTTMTNSCEVGRHHGCSIEH